MAFPLFLIKGASKLLKGVDSKDREALESTSDALNQDDETSSVHDQVSIPVEEVVEYPGNVDPESVESSDSLEGVPVFGSGINMFLRLSDVALKSWYKAILWIRRGKRYEFGSSSGDVQMETDALNEGTPDVEVQSPFGDDLDVSIDAKESESETFGTWSLLGVAGMLISGMLLSKKFRKKNVLDNISVEFKPNKIYGLLGRNGAGKSTLLNIIANFLNSFASLMGLDGYILTAFIFGIPANEIVLPIILMCYLGNGTLVNLDDTFAIGNILVQNGWTILTAINVMIFTCLHFPCTTT